MLDFHNHLIPGVDDGSSSLDESLSALAEMESQGITHVITTPHFRASEVNNSHALAARMLNVDLAWNVLSDAVVQNMPQMYLSRGVELALDEPSVSAGDDRIRLAGSRFMLVEFPYFAVPPNSARALSQLRFGGVTPIVAHPERYENLENDLSNLFEWKASGAFLQLNAGSLTGAYGKRVEKRAWRCLELGAVDYLSSDYHARGNCWTKAAKQLFEEYGGGDHFRLLTSVNGMRLLEGADPVPVPPLTRRIPRWRRLKSALGLSVEAKKE